MNEDMADQSEREAAYAAWERENAPLFDLGLVDPPNAYHGGYTDGRAAGRAELEGALGEALNHVSELVEAWRTGAITESDGLGGTRSNRNFAVFGLLRALLTDSDSDSAEAEGASDGE